MNQGPVGGSTWQPEHEHETSLRGGRTQEGRLTDSYVNSLYKELSKHYSRTSDATHYDSFECIGRWLYFKGRDEPLTNEDGKLRIIGQLTRILLGKNRLIDLGFDIPIGKITSQQAVILNKVEEEIPSTSDVAKTDDIELQEIVENASRSMENLNQQLKGESSEDFPMCELLGLDKQLRSIKNLLKVEVAKKSSWKKTSRKKSASLRNYENILEPTMMAFEKIS